MSKSQTQGIIWSAIERFSAQGIQFILSIIIALLVSPSDYGLIAMLTIFLSIAQSVIDSGFSNALIQKKNRTDIDYSTVFYFNICISILIYILFWYFSPFIASFYNEPQLTNIARYAGLNFIISAFAIVQRTQLTILLDFKSQAKITLVAITCGGGIGIYLAWTGYGVWSLVFQSLVTNFLTTLLLWCNTHWKPILVFSLQSFKQLFAFGSRLLLTGLLATIYSNLYSLVIGKFFNSQNLGFYNRMNTLASFPSSNITNIIARAVYPVQCNMQNNNVKLKTNFFQLLKISSFIIFPLMLGMAALSKPLTYVLLSEKWIPASYLLTLISFALMWNHVMYLNWQLLAVKGRSDLSFKSEIYKKIVSIVILCITIPLGIKAMCIGLICYSFFDMIIIIYFLKPLLSITHKEEVQILMPYIILSFSMFMIISLCISFIANYYLQLIIGFMIGFSYYIGMAYLLKLKELHLILNKIRKTHD